MIGQKYGDQTTGQKSGDPRSGQKPADQNPGDQKSDKMAAEKSKLFFEYSKNNFYKQVKDLIIKLNKY